MILWTNDELNIIGNADELQIAALRADGTLRKPVIIWVVRLGDELYVRSVNGRTSAWFRGAGASLRPDRPARSRPTRARARSRRP